MQTLKEEEEWSLLKIVVGLFVGILSALRITKKNVYVKIILNVSFDHRFERFQKSTKNPVQMVGDFNRNEQVS